MIRGWFFCFGARRTREKEKEKERERERERSIGGRAKSRNERHCPMCLAGGHVTNRLNVHWMFQQLENETAWTSRSGRGNPWKGKGQRHPLPRPCNRRDARRRCTVVASQPSHRPCRFSRKVSRFLISFHLVSSGSYRENYRDLRDTLFSSVARHS